MRWKSLWNGPTVGDNVKDTSGPVHTGSTWWSVGLYALDGDDQAWTYCMRLTCPQGKWLRFDELMSGEAGRRTHREREGA